MTQFSKIYDSFLGRITDDMYLEWTKQDTLKDLQSMLLQAIPNFDFPRFRLYAYNTSPIQIIGEGDMLDYTDNSAFEDDLTLEEINILAILMQQQWLIRQIASIENTRMKYSGSDFKMTSQANHLAKLINLKDNIEQQNRHTQRMYRRRRTEKDGTIKSNWDVLNTYGSN